MTLLEQVLWAVVGVLAIVFVVAYSSPTLPTSTPIAAAVPSATRAPQNVSSLRSPIPTRSPSRTPAVTATAAATEPLVIPTPPANATLVVFSPNPERTGWLGSKELGGHWRDRNLHSGSFQGQTLASVVQFDLRRLAPGSKILYAALEVTGRNAQNLGSAGQWKIDLIPSGSDSGWGQATFDTVSRATALASLTPPISVGNLAAGKINRFVLNASQIKVLESQLDQGIVTFRLEGPAESTDNLFTWEAGPGIGEPALYVVVVPASFVVITAAPTPANLFAAATRVVQQTEQARLHGTSTPFPRSVVTATPGASGVVVVTSVPTAKNPATLVARSAYATAVAATTGTFTPTPPNLVTATATPGFIAVTQLTPAPTPLPRPTEISLLVFPKTPIPPDSGLVGRIAYTTDRDGGRAEVWMMEPSGTVVGKLTGTDYYRVAEVHDLYSPDWQYHLDLAKDDRNKWEIVVYDVAKGIFSPMIQEERAMTGQGVYDPAWSPDGSKIAFVSNASVNSEIWVYDVKTQTRKRLTWSPSDMAAGEWAFNRHPSWSPDGKYIVYSAILNSRSIWQIWIINADGSGAHALSPSSFNDTDPVWIKR